MPVSYSHIPSNLRVPLFYAEMDNSQAFQFQQNLTALIIGMRTSAGTKAADTLHQLTGDESQAAEYFGAGSQLHLAYKAFRRNNAFGEVWCVPVDEPGAGVAAQGAITFTGAATASGTVALYIGGQLVEAAVASGDAAADVAAAVEAAIDAAVDLPVTASVAAGVVTLTAKHKGVYANTLDVRLTYLGDLGGQALPAGVAATIAAIGTTVAGTSQPDLANAFAALGDEQYEVIVNAIGTDATTLDAFRAEMNDSVGRWSYLRQLYGHVVAAKNDTVTNLTTLGNARNDQHHSILGYSGGLTPEFEAAGMFGAQMLKSTQNDPARPFQTLPLLGFLAPIESARHTLQEQNVLLYDGVSVLYYQQDGTARITRAITTYQKNAFNVADPSYLDVNTLMTSSYVIRYLKARITQKYPRHKLANDGTAFGPGQAIATPSILRGELIDAYADLEFQGIVENRKLFAEHLIVERNKNDPNRVDVLLPPDYVNQLRVFAVLNQFRLQYDETTDSTAAA